MIRFLNSIGIENVDDFDMDFQVAKLDPENPERLLMVILKKRGWNYYLFEEFLHALAAIEYPYTLSFRYESLEDADIISFFKEWFLNTFHLDCGWEIEIKNGEIILSVPLVAEKEMAERAVVIVFMEI